jgi:hypothetical protein
MLSAVMPPDYDLPIPLPSAMQQPVEFADPLMRDPVQHIGEPDLGIDLAELGCDDQGVHHGGTLGAAIRSGEPPCLAAEGQPAQRAVTHVLGTFCYLCLRTGHGKGGCGGAQPP